MVCLIQNDGRLNSSKLIILEYFNREIFGILGFFWEIFWGEVCFWVVNGVFGLILEFWIVDSCSLVYDVTFYDAKVYVFWTRCFG